jgi:putative ABC transport system permease protein
MDAPEISAWQEQNQVFSEMAIYGLHEETLTGDAEAQLINSAHVSPSFFTTLGATPSLGRGFLQTKDSPEMEQVAVISSALWRRRFGGDTNLLGRTIRLDNKPYTIVGVLPPTFKFIQEVDVLVPLDMKKRLPVILYHVIGRLRPNVSLAQATADLDRIYQTAKDPKVTGRIVLTTLSDSVMGNAKSNVLFYLGGTGFVLLIACANIANLLLARGANRRKEISIRVALGASRLRIVAQLLTESLLLALLGGTLGLLLGWWAKGVFAPLLQPLPKLQSVTIDARVVGFTLLLTVLTGVVFGLWPALVTSQLSLGDSLKEGTRSGGNGGLHQHRMSRLLVVSEVMLALVLLLGAGLLLKTFVRLQRVNLGFNPEQILSLRIDLSEEKYPDGKKQAAYFEQVIDRLRKLPGVEAVAIDAALPLGGYSFGMSQSRNDGKDPEIISAGIVNADYFRTMGIPLKKGRLFNDEDKAGSQPVALINESFARGHFANDDSLGKQVSEATIVGVVGDVRQGGPVDAPASLAYFCYLQRGFRSMSLAVRTKGNPSRLAGAIRAQIVSLDKDQPIHGLSTMKQSLSNTLSSQRVNMLLSGTLSLVALGLVAVGIYGVLSFSVAQRTHEIGVRMALGSRRVDVLKLVMAEGIILTLAGLLFGLLTGFGLTRFLSSLLWGVNALDPLTFACVSLFLLSVGAAACYMPARKAASLDPMVALRHD